MKQRPCVSCVACGKVFTRAVLLEKHHASRARPLWFRALSGRDSLPLKIETSGRSPGLARPGLAPRSGARRLRGPRSGGRSAQPTQGVS